MGPGSARRVRVAVLGGGIAGLTVAHELSERGFSVDVLERRDLFGGKARSFGVPGTSRLDGPALPAEHGFRFFPSFYKHLDHTLSRIPTGSPGQSVLERLVDVGESEIVCMGRPGTRSLTRLPKNLGELSAKLKVPALLHDLPREDIAYFHKRLLVFASSCQARRLEQFESVSWWDFLRASERSETYRLYMAHGLTQVLVAMRASDGSTRTIGSILMQLLRDMHTPGATADRVLDGPTNERFIDPWVRYLQARGVRFHVGHSVERFELASGRVQAVSLLAADGARKSFAADYVVSALPADRLAKVLSPALLEADPRLGLIKRLKTAWMVGLQLYLRTPERVVIGHGMCPDTPWALTMISQGHYWQKSPARYGDGQAHSILSVDISDWDSPGLLSTRTARQAHSKEEIKNEVWAQLKACLNRRDQLRLRDEDLLSWHLDPAIELGADGVLSNDDPLLVNTAGSWRNRPDAVTDIPNFFLAGDYVRTHTDLATMEGANESARRAVNGLLDALGSRAERCAVMPLVEPAWLTPLKLVDQLRFERGLAHFADDLPKPGDSAAGQASRGSRSHAPETISAEMLENAGL